MKKQEPERSEAATPETLSEQLVVTRRYVGDLKEILQKFDPQSRDARSYQVLQEWLQETSELAGLAPFSEIYRAMIRIVKSLSLTMSSYMELIDFCEDFSNHEGALALLFRDIQELRQTMESIQTERPIQNQQMEFLKEWLKYHAALSRKEPFNEIYQDVLNIYFKKKVANAKYEPLLLKLTKMEGEVARSIEDMPREMRNLDLSLITEVAVREGEELYLAGANLCFAGEMKAFTTKTWQGYLESVGASSCDRINEEVQYLVVGCDSNPCWEYSVYSCKVKKALKQKEAGARLAIIMESSLYRSAFLGSAS